MSYFVIIRGAAGVGKTTLARLLAKRINAEVFHFDDIMNELGMDYVPGDKWIPLEKFLKADKVMLPKFREILGCGKSIVIDGNFYHREQIEDLIEGLHFKNIVFTLKAEIKECLKRDKERKGPIGGQAICAVYKLVSGFDYGTIISTDGKTPAEVVEEMLSHLSK
jgi:predicted kinase